MLSIEVVQQIVNESPFKKNCYEVNLDLYDLANSMMPFVRGYKDRFNHS